MSGLVKQKNYDWKDSNLALFGSDTEKQVKKDSAETEQAWQGAGQKPGLQIWRIVKFQVEHWDKDQYGSFYSGDSYIILNTYKEPDNEELLYDVHFWIGKESTQDEYGTAAYKTVELDTLLDDKPVQHREVQGHESKLFMGYFKSITLMKGGADTGFRHVEPENYKPKLLHFHGKGKKITLTEVEVNEKNLDDSDVFILDAGMKYFQWNGKNSNHFERLKAAQHLQEMKMSRPKAQPATIDHGEKSNDCTEFEKCLREFEQPIVDDHEDQEDGSFTPSLYRLSNASGKLEFQLEVEKAELPLPYSKLESEDVFIADTGEECFVWVGNRANDEEKKNGMTYAHNYLQKSSHPLVPVSIVKEGREPKAFKLVVR